MSDRDPQDKPSQLIGPTRPVSRKGGTRTIAIWLIAAMLISVASYAVWLTTLKPVDPRLDPLWDLIRQAKAADKEPVIELEEIARTVAGGRDFAGAAACFVNPYAEVEKPLVVSGEDLDRYLGHETDETAFNFLIVHPRPQGDAKAVQQFMVGHGSLRMEFPGASQYWCGCLDAKARLNPGGRDTLIAVILTPAASDLPNLHCGSR